MGRTSLMMVMGFNLIFMFMGFNLSKITKIAYNKYAQYYEVEQAIYCVGSGINVAVASFYKDTGWMPSPDPYIFMSTSKFIIKKSWPGKDSITLFAEGIYREMPETSIVGLKRGKFSEYAMYSVNENGIFWITGDTCRGPLHTEDVLNVSGSPVFLAKVTTKNGLFKSPPTSTPQFAGYKSGITQVLPSSCAEVTTLGNDATGKKYSSANVWMDFYPDGKIAVRTPLVTSARTIYNNATSLTANTVVLVNNGDLHIKGTLKGRITLGCTGTGKVWLDSSIVYQTDPKSISPRCDDMLGIVADNDILITDNTNNTNPAKGVTIHASLFSRTSGLQAEHYNTRAISGKLKIVGGIQQKNRNPVGTFSGSTLITGFQKDYDFDRRLQTESPRGYPALAKFTVLNWFEKTNFPNGYFEE